jgi:hypothetical protein
MNPVAGFLEREGLPAPQRVIRLAGTLRGPDDRPLTPHLVLVDDDALLVGADSEHGVRIDALAAEPLRYVPGRLGDALVIGAHELGVPLGRADAVKQLLATARLRRSTRPEPAPPLLGERFVSGRRPLDRLWLATFLEPDEPLLAWLATDSEVVLASELGGSVPAAWRFVLTSQRAGLVAISAVGDVRFDALPPGASMTVTSSFAALGRAHVQAGALTWRTTWRNREDHELIAPLVALPAPERLLAFAALCWRAGKGSGAARAEARGVLALPAIATHPLAALARAVVLAEEPAPGEQADAARIDRAVRDLRRRGGDSSVLADWADTWRLPDAARVSLLERLLAGAEGDAAAAWALPFHRRLHQRLLAGARNPIDQAALDLGLAEHLHRVGAHEEMTALLEARLAALPAPELGDLVPPAPAHGAAPEGGRTVRARMQALLADPHADDLELLPPAPLPPAPLLALAMLEPLVPAHVARLAELATGEVAAAAREVHQLLLPGGLDAPVDVPAPAVHALPPGIVNQVIEHPSTRRGGVLAGLQSLLARVERPDRTVLTSYCERLDSGRHQAALTALRDAAMALGVPGIDGYLSRGDKSIGARAYEGRPPFLLLGVSHLEPGAALAMAPAELRFLIGAEVAHLRFGHTRLTSEDVWNGAWQTGRTGLDLLFTTLPALRGIRLVDRMQDLLDLYRIPVVGKVLERGMNKVFEKRRVRQLEAPEAVHIAPAYEDLLAAHRAMQLTADRAGLLLCGDLRSAIRAIFRSRAEYRAELPIAEHFGLAEALTRSDQRGEILFQDLAIRIAALIAFYLSPEYRQADRALRGEATPA